MFNNIHLFKIDGFNRICNEFLKFITLTLILFFVVFFLKSCTDDPVNDKIEYKAEGYANEIISGKKLANAEVHLLGWYESWLYPGNYNSIPIDTVFTDSNGHFQFSFNSYFKNGYSLNVIKEKYFIEEGIRSPVSILNNVNINLFPHGYVKTHITNKISSARWLEISFVPGFSSGQDIYRYGFINTWMLKRAFADTTFITTTIGGMSNKLRILMTPTESTTDLVTVKDTLFLTHIHDTVYINLILK